MAEVFAPFIISRTIGKLTFYSMEGRNFVRKKSSLTRRKVLYSPRFERTRQNASLMGRASKIGAFVYNELPAHWRQFWMYRSFTGEAYTMLKKGRGEQEIRQLLRQRYVQEVVARQSHAQPLPAQPVTSKRTYKKQDTEYWKNKTSKSVQRKACMQQRQHNSELLAEASKIASELYYELPKQSRKRSHYQELTGWAMKWLKEQEEDWVTMKEMAPMAPIRESAPVIEQQKKISSIGAISCKKGIVYFVPPRKRFCPANVAPLFFTSYNTCQAKICHAPPFT
jgi:hypothetical protein